MNNTANIKTKKHMGLGLVSAGFIFLFLPDFTVLDLLPDFIGYLMISLGLTSLGDLYEDILDAKNLFSRAIILGCAKLFSVFVVFGLSDGNDRPSMILMTIFVLSIAECIMLIPAYIKLFEGIVYMGTRESSTVVFENPRSKRKSRKHIYTDRVKRFTLAFVVIKNALAVLPETLALSATDNVQSYNYSQYDFINHFRLLSMIVSLILGIVWFVKIRRFFSALKNEKDFMDRLAKKYNSEIRCKESLFIRRRMKIAFLLFSIGIIAALDIYVDGNAGFNLIPDVLTAGLFVAGSLVAGEKKCVFKKLSVIASVLYGAVSAFSYYVGYEFNNQYHPLDVSRKTKAFEKWNIVLSVSIVEAACFILMIAAACLLIYQIVKAHTGYIPIHATIDPLEKSREVHYRLKKLLVGASVAAIFSAVSGIFRIYSFSIDTIAEGSWWIELFCTAILSAFFIWMLLKINEEIKEKYLLS